MSSKKQKSQYSNPSLFIHIDYLKKQKEILLLLRHRALMEKRHDDYTEIVKEIIVLEKTINNRENEHNIKHD